MNQVWPVDHSHIPPVWGKDERGQPVVTFAEGGFGGGIKAKVTLPGDQWDGKTVTTISTAATERTVLCTNGPLTFRYCVAALIPTR